MASWRAAKELTSAEKNYADSDSRSAHVHGQHRNFSSMPRMPQRKLVGNGPLPPEREPAPIRRGCKAAAQRSLFLAFLQPSTLTRLTAFAHKVCDHRHTRSGAEIGRAH